MLEALLIFTRGGLILWSSCGGALGAAAAPVDALIRSCLLEDRAAAGATFSHGAHALRWAFCNSLGLVFVAVYRRVLQLLYVDDLLDAVRREFGLIYHPKRTDYANFTDVFRQLHHEAEARAEAMKQQPVAPRPSSRDHSHNNNTDSEPNPNIGGAIATGGKKKKKKKGKRGDSGSGGKDADSDGTADSEKNTNPADNRKNTNSADNSKKTNPADNDSNWAFDISKIQRLINRGKKTKPADNGKTAKPDNGRKKFNRAWKDKPANQKLDFTDPAGDGERGDTATDRVRVDQGQSMMDKDESEDKQQQELQDGTKNNGGWLSSMFQSIAGNNVLDKSDLQPALKALKDRLMTKNVAEEIAEKLCESVAASLEGKKLGSFTRVSSTVQTAMEEALVRILTPRRSIDILRDVQSAKEQGRPYVIVFVGVNGVGKSTNLAKVAYWLLQHNLSVTLAACDTFRSGAVEQLRTHARRLQIPIFEKGYERDPAVVAKEAIQDATRNKSDVVLVDTAGRMQDNEPLMRALSKLINLNNPELVLFVGEALVGNDAVDQLTKFNQKLGDLSGVPTARLIDGILLTKFDTIDDKVGAALSMVYISGAPVMFVGCGQSYTDLKKLNVKSIVKTFLK